MFGEGCAGWNNRLAKILHEVKENALQMARLAFPIRHFWITKKGIRCSSNCKKVRKNCMSEYRLFLEGKIITEIAAPLTDYGGKKKWTTSTIKNILTNKKYKRYTASTVV